jgi:hypothetical protein
MPHKMESTLDRHHHISKINKGKILKENKEIESTVTKVHAL